MRPSRHSSVEESESPWLSTTERDSNLSRSQFLIWMGQKIAGPSPLYNQAFAFELRGELDSSAFELAFLQEVATNDALRTVIDEVHGVPIQRVVPPGNTNLDLIDLSIDGDANKTVNRLLENRAQRVFDLSQSLVDSVLCRLAPDHHVWFLNQHHIITDAWGCGLIYDRVMSIYRGETGNPQPSYQEHVTLDRQKRSEARSPMRTDSKPVFETLDLYGIKTDTDHVGSTRVGIYLNIEEVDRLRNSNLVKGCLSPDLGIVNFFTTVLSIFVARTGSTRRLSVGLPIHNRTTSKLKKTPGLFIEMLPLAVEVQEADTFASLFQRVSEQNLDLLRLARPGVSTPEDNRRQSVVLNYINRKLSQVPGLTCQTQWIHSGAVDANHKIRVQVHDLDDSGGLHVLFDLNTQLFSRQRRDDVRWQFSKLLKYFLGDPNASIWSGTLLSPKEATQLKGFNDTIVSYPQRSLTDWLRGVWKASATEIAVECGTQTLSYQDLDRKVSRLATALMARGVGHGSIVPVYMPRSLQAVVTIFGVLRTGAAFLPLNINEPVQRLRKILEDVAQSDLDLGPVVVSESTSDLSGFDIFLWNSKSTDFNSDGSWSKRSHGDLSYVMYTSGSTGQPKGVMVNDEALLNYLEHAVRVFGGGKPLDFPLHSLLSVDLTLTSLFVPLLSGGRVVVYDEDDDELPVLRAFAEDKVDAIKLTPAHLALITEMSQTAQRIKTVIVGGEALRVKDVRQVLERFGDTTTFYNEYGPTEAAVGCMLHRFSDQADRWRQVPIGQPIGNVRMNVVGPGMEFTPTGVTGELVVSGSSLASGYLNAPDFTAEKFFRHPALGRTYKTGDLARWTDDGLLELLGRSDDQLKIRGVRAEATEIEYALTTHPNVQNAVVTLLKTKDAEQLAYCTRCGMPSNHPDVRFSGNQVCNLCLAFDEFGEQAQAYFKTPDDLVSLVSQIQSGAKDSAYDCLVLFSGGKDSSYMLYQLVELGLRPLAVTLDNGYISDGAKENIEKAVSGMGIHHRYLSTPHMDEIFADSLRRHSNVCNGCFKTIYTLSTNLCRELGVRYVFTGLSRGQIFETRLHDLFRHRIFDVDRIEQQIIDARKVYHRIDDAVSRRLDVGLFQDNNIFSEIQFVDYYRYVDVPLSEVYRYLKEQAPWVRPSDTGRSTNCLINDIGIHVHKKERGFHNYALPYSWDVRLGHKTRAEALDELNDDIDRGRVDRIQRKIGYTAGSQSFRRSQELVAFYTGHSEVSENDWVHHLKDYLPSELIPGRFIRLEAMPLASNGKVDRRSLPSLARHQPTNLEPASSDLEKTILAIWRQVLGSQDIGVTQDFFQIGGHSLPAIQVLAQVNERFSLELPIAFLFEQPTIRKMAAEIERLLVLEIEAMSDAEVERLLKTGSS